MSILGKAIEVFDNLDKGLDWGDIWNALKMSGKNYGVERVADFSSGLGAGDSVPDVLEVDVLKNGDVALKINQIDSSPHIPNLRFNSGAGGGKSLRVRTALIILALAIAADNEEQ